MKTRERRARSVLLIPPRRLKIARNLLTFDPSAGSVWYDIAIIDTKGQVLHSRTRVRPAKFRKRLIVNLERLKDWNCRYKTLAAHQEFTIQLGVQHRKPDASGPEYACAKIKFRMSQTLCEHIYDRFHALAKAPRPLPRREVTEAFLESYRSSHRRNVIPHMITRNRVTTILKFAATLSVYLFPS